MIEVYHKTEEELAVEEASEIVKSGSRGQGTRKRVADKVIELALAKGLELFVTPTGDTYGRIPVGKHKEVYRINSKAFRNWLRELYYTEFGHGFGNSERDEIRDTLEARAAHSGHIENVYVRIARHKGKVYLDLADNDWQVVEIDKYGWRVRKDSPVNFRREKGMLPLPEPVDGGSINELKDYIQFSTEEEFILTVAWVIGAYHPTGPYPILVFVGQAGSGKTTRAKMLSMLIDPREPAVRVGVPNMEGVDLSARNSWLLVFDNLSNVPTWLSDRLCTLSTGGGTSKRKLYEDDEEVIFDAKRPVILTGIDELATRGDLLDRSLPVYPQRIEQYRPEKQLLDEYSTAQPLLLGAVLDGVSSALAGHRQVELGKYRMADFAAWATAAEDGLGWEDGTFVRAYDQSIAGASGLALEASPVATEIMTLLKENGAHFEGTVKELLDVLNAQRRAEDREQKYDRSWPRLPHRLSSDLNRIAPNLKNAGIEVKKLPRTKQGQPISIRRIAEV